MSQKKLTDEELFAQFEDIPSEEAVPASTASVAAPTTTTTTTARSAAKGSKGGAAVDDDDDDPLAELSALAAARPTSRPGTPRMSSASTKRTEHTPASSGPPSERTSEDKKRTTLPGALRKSTESTRSNLNQSFVAPNNEHITPSSQQQQQHQATTPAQTKEETAGTDSGAATSPSQPASGGGWWGSVFNVATAAVKQAEAAVKEIRSNDEVLKYAEQMKGNVKSLREYGEYEAEAPEILILVLVYPSQPIHVLISPSSRRKRTLSRSADLSIPPSNNRSSYFSS